MRYLTVLIFVGALFLFVGVNKPPTMDVGERHRGVSWVGSRNVTADDVYFESLAENHVNWIVQTPFGWQSEWNDPNLRLNPKAGWWGERDEGLRVTTRQARKFGVKTLLKPHIWMHSRDGKWRSDIEMADEKSWALWFENYRAFIMHYAKLAAELEIEALCIGTELRRTVVREKEWRALITEIRDVYDGELTYAANWYKEYTEVPFWDQMDYIGIQAYFPLVKKDKPSVREMIAGWQPHLADIEALQRKVGKPVVFTEVGYRNTANNAIEPWLWPKRVRPKKKADGTYERLPPSEGLDPEAQADAFRAMFDVFWDRPWFKGAYIWKWFPQFNGPQSARVTFETFSPQNQPAMDIIREYYGREAEKGSEYQTGR